MSRPNIPAQPGEGKVSASSSFPLCLLDGLSLQCDHLEYVAMRVSRRYLMTMTLLGLVGGCHKSRPPDGDDLWKAASDGDLARVQWLVDHAVGVDARASDVGVTALFERRREDAWRALERDRPFARVITQRRTGAIELDRGRKGAHDVKVNAETDSLGRR